MPVASGGVGVCLTTGSLKLARTARCCSTLNTSVTKDNTVYKIFLLNFGYYLDFETDNLEQAMAKAVSVGFDAAVCTDQTIVKIHRPIGGWH